MDETESLKRAINEKVELFPFESAWLPMER